MRNLVRQWRVYPSSSKRIPLSLRESVSRSLDFVSDCRYLLVFFSLEDLGFDWQDQVIKVGIAEVVYFRCEFFGRLIGS